MPTILIVIAASAGLLATETRTHYDANYPRVEYVRERGRSRDRDALQDFIEAAKAITPKARAVPPTHLPAPEELRFVFGVAGEELDEALPRRRPWLTGSCGARRERRPLRSRPGFRVLEAR